MLERLPRILIVDACVLFSFFKSDSVRRRIIEELPNLGCRLISPEFAFRELLSDKEKIMKFGKIDELSFEFLFSLLERKIEPFPEEVYKELLSDASKISPHGEQTKDDPYFALALAFNSPVGSDEFAFKQQNKVKVFSTEDLAKLLGLR